MPSTFELEERKITALESIAESLKKISMRHGVYTTTTKPGEIK